MSQVTLPEKRLLRTQGLSCQGCISGIRRTLLTQDPQAELIGSPDDQLLLIHSQLSEEALQKVAQESGYPLERATLPESRTVSLEVHGMHCQKCVAKLRTALQHWDESAEVSGVPADNALQVDSALPRALLERIVLDSGYSLEAVEDSDAAVETVATTTQTTVEDNPAPVTSAA